MDGWFSAADLEAEKAALDEFQTRHTTIRQRINETYKVGNKMVDYLERQVILDYHFRGEQDIFEQEFPQMKQKTEEYIGYEMYFDMSPLTGTTLSADEHPLIYKHPVDMPCPSNRRGCMRAPRHHDAKPQTARQVIAVVAMPMVVKGRTHADG